MEQTTVKNLPEGTLAGLSKKAKKEGFVCFNGRPNMQAYIRDTLAKLAGVKR